MADYSTYVFDCDGVVLDSNRIKTEAFRDAVQPYGDALAQAMVDYHVAHGGISRYRKFEHFLTEIVPVGQYGPDLETLLARYATAVAEGLRRCAVMPGIESLRLATVGARWLIVSGGDQAELRTVFAERGLDAMFDGGIFGSPDTKDEILAREMAHGTIAAPALFLGDSVYDFQAASRAGIDFVFISGWTELPDWRDFIADHDINHLEWGSDLLARSDI